MSRPRRNLLLYCHDKIRLSVLRFVLQNLRLGGRGFCVHGAGSMDGVMALVNEVATGFYEGAVVVHCYPEDDAISISTHLVMRCGIPTLFLTEGAGLAEAWQYVTATRACAKETRVFEWLIHLRCIVARRQGPKKAAGKIIGPAIQAEPLEVRI